MILRELEIYLLLFIDSLICNLSIVPSSEFVIYSMNIFGKYSNYKILFFAIMANILAFSLNYLLGIAVAHIFRSDINSQKIPRYRKFKEFMQNQKILFSILSAIPFFGKFIQVVFGAFNLPFLQFLSTFILAKFSYYAYNLWF